MTTFRLLVFVTLVAVVLAFTNRFFAVGWFALSVLPALFAIPYVRSLARSHRITAVATATIALSPVYASSMGPLNAIIAVCSYKNYAIPDVVENAMLVAYQPLGPLLCSAPLASSTERYLDDWGEIGISFCRGFGVPPIDPTTGLPFPAQEQGGG